MKYVWWILVFVIGMMSVSFAQEYILFYGNGCPHCGQVEQYFDEHDVQEQFDLEMREIYFNRDNLVVLQGYLEKLGLDTHQIGVPFLVVNNLNECSYINGSLSIIAFFQQKIDMMKALDEEDAECNTETCVGLSCEDQTLEEIEPVVQNILYSTQSSEDTTSSIVEEISDGSDVVESFFEVSDVSDTIETSSEISGDRENVLSDITSSSSSSKWWFFAIMMPAAISDSINPCAFAVMLLLLTTILSRHQSRRKTILSGLFFSLAVFISYLAMGLGIFSALATTSNTFVLKLVVGILGILVWLANLKDYFRYGKFFVMEVPMSRRPKLQDIIHKVSSPLGAFVVGLVVSIFLLPCSSGPYFTILGFLSSQSKELHTRWFFYLVVYNLLFVLPMVIIALLVGFGRASVDKLAKIKHQNMKAIHLIVWLLMLGLGAYVLLTI